MVLLSDSQASSLPDFNENGVVDFPDFLLFAQHYGSTEDRFDIDGDGTVGFSDFLLFVKDFGKRPPKPPRPPHLAYNIDIVFEYEFTPHQKDIIKRAVRRWEEVITGDLPDIKRNVLLDIEGIDDWSSPASDAVAEFQILSIQSLCSGHKQPFLQLLTTSRPIRQQHLLKGKMQGHWSFRYPDGGRGDGPIVNDLKHGFWIFHNANGNILMGPWVNGKRHGHWTLKAPDGTLNIGEYVNHKKHGLWVIQGPDGERKEKIYKNGVLTNSP